MCCRQQVEDLLIDVCSGIGAEELPAALQGLTAASDHVRMAALSALEFVPVLAQGEASCLDLRGSRCSSVKWRTRHYLADRAVASDLTAARCDRSIDAGGHLQSALTQRACRHLRL